MSKTRPTFKDTIDAIHRTGGQAFLAHAGRYKDKMPVEDYMNDIQIYQIKELINLYKKQLHY